MKLLFLCLFINIGIASSQIITAGDKKEVHIPPIPISPDGGRLVNEVDSLNQVRETNIYKLIESLSKSCNEASLDRIIISIEVKPSGEISELKEFISKIENCSLENEILECVTDKIFDNDFNLGQIKVVPNEKNGTNPLTITYAIPF